MGAKYVFNPLTGNLDTTDVVAFNGEVDLGTAAAPSIFFTGDPNTGIYSPGADQVAISTNGQGRLFVDASGNVGISGTPVSTAKLRVLGGNAGQLLLDNDGSRYTQLLFQRNSSLNSGGDIVVDGDTSDFRLRSLVGSISFQTSTAPGVAYERLRITSDGKLGLGTSSPSAPLDVVATSTGWTASIKNNAGSGTQSGLLLSAGSTSSDFALYVRSAAETSDFFAIKGNGNVGIGTTSPAYQCVLEGATPYLQLKQTGTNFGSSRLIFGDADTASPGQIIYDHSSSSLQAVVNGSERARIDSSGRLLVGTTSSSDLASVVLEGYAGGGANAPSILWMKRKENAATISPGDGLGLLRFGSSDSGFAAEISAQADTGWASTTDAPGRLVFSTTADGASSPTERMRITRTGAILLGCTSAPNPGAASTSNGWAINGTGATAYVTAKRDDNPIGYFRRDGTDGELFVFYKGNATVGNISVTASATAYNTSSDYRLKENVVPLTGAIDRVSQLQVHRFNFIADPSKTVDGFLAHEAQAVVPECVTGTKDEVDEDGNPVYQGIDQSKLVPLLTAALQEALTRIEQLETKVAALEGA